MSFYLVTAKGHALENGIFKGTGEVFEGGYIGLEFAGDSYQVLESDLTEITQRDYHYIFMERIYDKTETFDRVLSEIADGTY